MSQKSSFTQPSRFVSQALTPNKLGWAVIAMGASGIYELRAAEEAQRVVPFADPILFGLIGVMAALPPIPAPSSPDPA